MVGSGYIGVELAGIFHAFGTKTNLIIRRDRVLTSFDEEVGVKLTNTMIKNGVNVIKNSGVKKIEKIDNGLKKVTLNDDSTLEVEEVFYAIGRAPDTNRMDIEKSGVALGKHQEVIVDEFSNTNVENIYAVGDCINRIALTPVAIREARILCERLFNNQTNLKMDYEYVASVIFSHPPVASCGLTEAEAKKKFGEENVKTHISDFNNMYYSLCEQNVKQPSFFKVITVTNDSDRVVGCHLMGKGVDEMMQTMAVCMKMGATKVQLDSAVAIHPTGSEELVLLPPFR